MTSLSVDDRPRASELFNQLELEVIDTPRVNYVAQLVDEGRSVHYDAVLYEFKINKSKFSTHKERYQRPPPLSIEAFGFITPMKLSQNAINSDNRTDLDSDSPQAKINTQTEIMTVTKRAFDNEQSKNSLRILTRASLYGESMQDKEGESIGYRSIKLDYRFVEIEPRSPFVPPQTAPSTFQELNDLETVSPSPHSKKKLSTFGNTNRRAESVGLAIEDSNKILQHQLEANKQQLVS